MVTEQDAHGKSMYTKKTLGHFKSQNILMSCRLTIVGDELLEALRLVEDIKTFWLSRYSLINLIVKATWLCLVNSNEFI